MPEICTHTGIYNGHVCKFSTYLKYRQPMPLLCSIGCLATFNQKSSKLKLIQGQLES